MTQGIINNRHFTLGGLYQSFISKAPVWRGMLSRVTCSLWGLECGVPTMTRNAFATSHLRYALTVLGSFLPQDLFPTLRTQIVNKAAKLEELAYPLVWNGYILLLGRLLRTPYLFLTVRIF